MIRIVEITPERLVVASALRHLSNGKLVQAVLCLRKNGLSVEEIEPALSSTLEDKLGRGAVNEVLSVLFHTGEIGPCEVIELLKLQFSKKDYHGFLKQVMRFQTFDELKPEIEETVRILSERFPDQAPSLRNKLLQMFPAESSKERATWPKLSENPSSPTLSLDSSMELIIKSPLRTEVSKPVVLIPENQELVDWTLAIKRRQEGTAEHNATLHHLARHLTHRKVKCRYTQLIDLICESKDQTHVFEIKSIHRENERDQIRAAVSQLYEYRYLYKLDNSVLWIVLSKEPDSLWFVDYLTKDRGIKTLWTSEGGQIAGPSLREFITVFA
jgi:hypothetical protein